MPDSPDLTPLILLVDDQESSAAAVESILRPKGHVVLKAHTGQQALDLVGKVSPDVVLVDIHLPDGRGVDLVRRLSASRTIHATTPILMVSKSVIARAQRLDALSAGAWDILVHPLDPSELILRIDTFVRVKQDADRARDHGLTDPGTGFYNLRGILRRTQEISADSVRSDRPLTCVAFGPQPSRPNRLPDETAMPGDEISRPMAEALRQATRLSDTIGKLGPGEFVVIAPGTNEEGAARLADRVLEAIERHGPEVPSSEALALIRAGVCVVEANEATSAQDLLLRATLALRRAQSEAGSFRVRSFDA